MTTASYSGTSAPTVSPSLLALRYLALLSTLNVLFQGGTAGEVLMKNHEAFVLHEAGAIALHVLTGLATVVAALYWRSTRTSLWPAILAAVVFVASFVQAAVGHGRTLYIHVPLALLLLLGSTWLLAWSWLAARQPAAQR